MKKVSEIRDVRIVPAESLFPGNESVKGRFIALGVCGVDDRPVFSGVTFVLLQLKRLILKRVLLKQ